jgi:hypothetical protein
MYIMKLIGLITLTEIIRYSKKKIKLTQVFSVRKSEVFALN